MKTNLVDAALRIDESSLHYRIELAHDDAREFLRRSPVYNGIPKNISAIVDTILAVVGPMKYGLCNGAPNSNDGKFGHVQIQVGNEGSRVIYVSGHRTPGSPSTKQILSGLKAVGRQFAADESDCVESASGPFEHFSWRYWWD